MLLDGEVLLDGDLRIFSFSITEMRDNMPKVAQVAWECTAGYTTTYVKALQRYHSTTPTAVVSLPQIPRKQQSWDKGTNTQTSLLQN